MVKQRVLHYSPIALFTYNRPWHTQETVEALLKNEEASESDLIVFSDGAKDEASRDKVNEVRSYLRTVHGFKSIRVVEREENLGLASSIIQGVTEVVNEFGSIIVLEDDLVTSPYFLRFMNDALSFYANKSKVMHISGWNYPIEQICLNDMFFWGVMNCWGWATWADRWQYYERDVDKVISNFSSEMIEKFDLGHSGIFWSQVVGNQQGKLNTWAIFWYAAIFIRSGLCLNPSQSYVVNIGHDGSGIHCGKTENQNFYSLNMKQTLNFERKILESIEAVEKIKEYFKNQKKPFWIRTINKVSRNVIGRNIIE
ncbi:MAG: glycosyltransferase [Desulfurivibrionaceae bacterium]